MRHSIGSGASVLVVILVGGCGESRPPCSAAWVIDAPLDARAILRVADDVAFETVPGVPIQAVTGRALSPYGGVVGGVSSEADLFWDAWVVPFDGGSPRRLAPIGDALVSVDASGALWTTIVSEEETGTAAHEIRVSPADGSPSVPLSPQLPAAFRAERAVTDGDGGRLLVGTEALDGASRVVVFAVGANGDATRVACDPRSDSALVLAAALAPDALHVVLQYTANGPMTAVKIAR